MIHLKNKSEIEKLYSAGQIVKETLLLIEEYIKPGISTLELDSIAENFIRSKNPITSLIAVGHLANKICQKSNSRPYGANSAWEKLTNYNSSILFLGIPLAESLTYLHYIEFLAGVPHMYVKKFNIPIITSSIVLSTLYAQT